MIELSFRTTNYFENYVEFRKEFVVSTCATISRNYKAMEEARKFYEDNKNGIHIVLAKHPNPFSEYKKFLNPQIWANFELATTVFHYVDKTKILHFVNPAFMKIASKINKELLAFSKSDYKGNVNSIFDIQMNRVKKSIIDSVKTPNKLPMVTKEMEHLIVIMTVVREFVGEMTSHAHDTREFGLVSQSLYNYVAFYRRTYDVVPARTNLIKNLHSNFNREIRYIMGILGMNGYGGEVKSLTVESFGKVRQCKTVEDIKKLLEGTEVAEYLTYEELDLPLAQGVRNQSLLPTYNGPVTGLDDIYTMMSGTMFTTYQTEVTETDDIVINRDLIIHIIGVAILNAKLFRPHVIKFLMDITVNIRTSGLMKVYNDELNKQTQIEVVTVETENETALKELRKEKEKNFELTHKCEVIPKLEEENEQLQQEVRRMKEEIEKLSVNKKELQALRSLEYHRATFDDEVEESALEKAIAYLSDKKLLLVGGIPSWANRFKDKLKNIQHLDADSQNQGLASKVKIGEVIVIYNTAYNSHGVDYTIMPAIEKNPDAKLVMVYSHKNIDRLIEFAYEQVK